LILDFPRQPFLVQRVAFDLMHGREPTFRSGGQLTHYSSATDYWADLTNREAHGEAMIDYWDDLKSEEP
jgi:hypothetical protein